MAVRLAGRGVLLDPLEAEAVSGLLEVVATLSSGPAERTVRPLIVSRVADNLRYARGISYPAGLEADGDGTLTSAKLAAREDYLRSIAPGVVADVAERFKVVGIRCV